MTAPIRLAIVGLGPGDPELITLKGLRRIQSAAVIFLPRSQERGQSLARQIAAEYLDESRQRIVELPLVMARNPAQMVGAWQAAADLMAATLPVTGEAAYLLLGDPMLYGTFSYLVTPLRLRRPDLVVEWVPGVNSYSAAAAAAALPLALGDERIAIVPAAYEEDAAAILALLEQFDTLVLLKAGSTLPLLKSALTAAGLADHVLVAELEYTGD